MNIVFKAWIFSFILAFGSLLIFATITPYVFGQNGVLNSAILVGDISCSSSGKATINAISKENATVVLFLGDLSYKSSTSCVSDYIKQLKSSGVKAVFCDIGNHDAAEDESATLEKAYFKLCADGDGFFNIRLDTLTLVGLNTQRSLKTDTAYLSSIESNKFMVTTSHKQLCEGIKSKHGPVKCDTAFSNELKKLDVDADISGHNHCMAFDGKGNFVSGAGGKSHYTCSGWSFINDKVYGYLLVQVYSDHLAFTFKDQKNKALSKTITVT